MKKKMDKLFFLSCCYSHFINGLLALMTGAILAYLMEDYGLTYNQGGLLISMQAIGILLAVLFSGVIVHFLGRRITLVSVGILFSIGFGGLILTSSPILLFVFIFLTGIGWGINSNLLNVLVSEATDGDSGYINILHMSFAVGAFMAPIMISLFRGQEISWKVPVALVALASISVALLFLKIPIEEPVKQQKVKINFSFDFLKDPKYMIYLMIFFCYVGAETGLNAWLISYLVQQNLMAADKAPLMLSVLWAAIIIGRMTVAYVSRYIRKDLLLAGISISAFVFISLFLLNKDPNLTMILVIAIGLSLAGIYPTNVSNASYILTGTAMATGILFAGGALGASVVPYLAGAIAEKNGILAGLISTLVVVFVMVILTIINVILIQKERT